MTQSPEYPDLLWMPPKSWTDANRGSVQLIVIHTTEGSEHGSSAEDGAAYDQRRTDGTSTHYFHDSNSTVQCVRTEDQAHAARTQGNKRGIQHELCADAADTWGDDYHQAVLRMAAKQAARDAAKWGIPIKKLTSQQVHDGVKGFCGHADVTYAFPEDNGTHTDPGSNFPWSQFLAMVESEGDDMPTAEEIAKAVWNYQGINGIGGVQAEYQTLADTAGRTNVIKYDTGVLRSDMQKVLTGLSDLAGKDFTDEQAIISGVLAGLAGADGAAETIADAVIAALPPDLAQQVVDEMGLRLSASEPNG